MTSTAVPVSVPGQQPEAEPVYEDGGKPCPESEWNWLGKVTYWWVGPLLRLGYKRPLRAEHLWQLPPAMTSDAIDAALQSNWQAELERSQRIAVEAGRLSAPTGGGGAATDEAGLPAQSSYPFVRALVNTFKRQYLYPMIVFRTLLIVTTFARPILLQLLLSNITSSDGSASTSNPDPNSTDPPTSLGDTRWLSFLYVGALVIVAIVQASFVHWFYWLGVKCALSVRSACIYMIYKKALRLNMFERREHTAGSIVNMASVDSDNLMNFAWASILELWASPLTLAITLFYLVAYLGMSAFVGVGVMVASLSISGALSRWMGTIQSKSMAAADHRLRLINEMLSGIKLIKLYAWESKFLEQIVNARREQFGLITRINRIGVFNRILGACVPSFVSLGTFGVFVLTGGTLDAPTAFTALLLFNTLREPLGKLPEAIGLTVRCWISQNRISRFLLATEKPSYVLPNGAVAAAASESAAISAANGDLKDELNGHENGNGNGNGNGAIAAPKRLKPKHPPPPDLSVTISNGAFDWGGATAPPDDGDDKKKEKRTNSKAQDKPLVSIAVETAPAKPNKSKTKSATDEPELELSQLDTVSLDSSTATPLPPVAAAPATAGDAVVPAVLSDINLRIPGGHLVIVVGSVGSGKSSLLSALLGEIQLRTGQVHVPATHNGASSAATDQSGVGSISYTSQLSWMLNDTIRGNILFGRPMDQARYDQTIRVCALTRDLSILPFGDETEIGENGINMSGGQKQRISLARAVYADANLYLLDEPLSAVDAHVGKHLFEKCLSNTGVLKGKTRILVTHQLQFLRGADSIVVMSRGRIQHFGTYAQLTERGVDFSSIVDKNRALIRTASASDTPARELSPAPKPRSPLAASALATAANGESKQHTPTHALGNGSGNGNGRASASGLTLSAISETDGEAAVPSAATAFSAAGPAAVAGADADSDENAILIDTKHSSSDHKHEALTAPIADSSATAAAADKAAPAPPSAVEDEDEENSMAAKMTRKAAGKKNTYASLAMDDGTSSKSPNGKSADSDDDVGDGDDDAPANGAHTNGTNGTANGTKKKGKTKKATNLIITRETVDTGFATNEVYKQYMLASGGKTLVGLATFFVVTSQATFILSDLYLAYWTGHGDTASLQDQPVSYYVNWYVMLAFIAVGLFACRMYLILQATLVAATTLHDRLLNGLVRAPMSFFDTTPSGRIMNRCGKDQDICDAQLPSVVQDIFSCSVAVLGTVALICYIAPLSAIPMAFITAGYWWIQKYYRPSSRELKRMEAISRSAVYSHFTESIHGLCTIRAYHDTARFEAICRRKIDRNTCFYFHAFAVNRWLGWRLEMVGALTLLVASGLALVLSDSLGAAMVGLSITSTLALSGNLNWMVRQISELEVLMNAVERVIQYGKTPSEAESVVAGNRPPEHWPSAGAVEFSNLQLCYREGLPPVLRGINCAIKPREKIGIVGRTGAGKSTFSLAMFRLIEPSGGTIVIDGIDITRIGLFDLRSKMSIIPQDPILFEGTMRMNLDPFKTMSDDELWAVLDRIGMGDTIRRFDSGLDLIVDESGENFSLGERQLLCLARAMTRKSKIVIMDEASASLDFETDQLIRQFVEREFVDCTVITIAHRLHTIMNSTRIMVLDKGEVVEFDTPSALAAKPDGYFAKLLRDAEAGGSVRIHRENSIY